MTGKRRPRARRSNTPPPPPVGERKAPEERLEVMARVFELETPAPPESRDDSDVWSEPPPSVSESGSFEGSIAAQPQSYALESDAPENDAPPESDAPPEEYPPEMAASEVEPPARVAEPKVSARGRHSRSARFLTIAVLLGAAICAFALLRAKLVRGRAGNPVAVVETRSSIPAMPAAGVPVLAGRTVTPLDEDASALDIEAARFERVEAVRALEAHDVPRALESAELAVKDDPSEAEGWLILGAAHLYRGDHTSAQQAFKACIEKAKTGRRDECAALLR